MKRTLTKMFSLLTAMAMVFTLLPVQAFAAADDHKLKYTENRDGTLTITGAEYLLNELTIPEEIDGKRVTAIGDKAFYNLLALKSVEIPASVTSIGEYAFAYCKSLTSVKIPASVTSFGSSVFYQCDRLKSAGPIGEGYDIEFGWTESIPADAFAYCKSLTSVKIPDSVTSIGEHAFHFCSNLTGIEIPANVTSIGIYAFSGCNRLKSAGPVGEGYDIEFGWTQSIPDRAFRGCNSLTSVKIPDSVTSIGKWVFSNCNSLTRIEIPANVTSIGEYTFYGCDKLKSAGPIGGGYNIEFGWTESIPANAFYDCETLTSVKIPDGVTSIEKDAFQRCESLESVELSSSVTSIREWAFAFCKRLTNIELPSGMTSIGNSAFQSCIRLESIRIPESVTSVGGCVFSYCDRLKSAGPVGGGYNIEFGWTKNIPANAFFDCGSLTSVKIPDGVTSIGESVFLNCNNLERIEIPNSVTSIGFRIFTGCSGLKNIYYGGSESQWRKIKGNDWWAIPSTATIHYQSSLPRVLDIKTNHNGLTVTTMPGVTDVRLCNESGLMLGCRVIRGSAGEDGSRSWTLTLPAGMECRDREVKIMTRDAHGKLTDSGVRATLNVTAAAPGLEEIIFTDAAGEGRAVSVQATSGLDAARISVYNESGQKMGLTSLSYRIVDGQKIWTGVMPIGTMGERTFTAYAVNQYGVKSEALTDDIAVKAFA